MFPFFSKSKGQVEIIFDITRESVGACVVVEDKNSFRSLVYLTREHFAEGRVIDTSRRLIELMTASVEKIRVDISRHILSDKAFRHRDIHTTYVFSSPWIETRTKIVTVTYKSPTHITAHALDHVRVRESEDFMKNIALSYGKDKKVFSIVGSHIAPVAIDGVPTIDPVGREALSLTLSLSLSFMPKEIIDRLGIGNGRGETDIVDEAVSFGESVAEAFGTLGHSDLVLMHMLGESTHIYVIRDGRLSREALIPFGTDNPVPSSDKSGLSKAQAASLSRAGLADDVDLKTQREMDPVFARARKNWSDEFKKTYRTLGAERPLPQKIFVIKNTGRAFPYDVPEDYAEITGSYIKNFIGVPDGLSDSALLLLALGNTGRSE